MRPGIAVWRLPPSPSDGEGLPGARNSRPRDLAPLRQTQGKLRTGSSTHDTPMLLDLTLEDTYGTHGANVVQFSRLSRRHAAADSRQPGSVFCLVAGAAGRCSLSPVAPPALQFPSSVLSARMDMAAVHLQP